MASGETSALPSQAQERLESYKYRTVYSYISTQDPFITIAMSASIRDAVIVLPPAEVPGWVKGDQAAIYLFTVVSTLVIYDAGELLHLYMPC